MTASLRRWCLSFVLLAVIGPVWAQMVPPPDVVPADETHIAHAEVATARWSAAQLQAWEARLRNVDGVNAQFPQDLLPPEGPAFWRGVDLPEVALHQGDPADRDDAVAPYEMRWYRFRYTASNEAAPLALYAPRLVTLAAAVLVRTDTGWRAVFDNQESSRKQWVRPLWAPLPMALTGRAPVLDVLVAVPVLAGSPYTVSSFWLGPREALQSRYDTRRALQIAAPQAIDLTLAVLGVFAFTLWVRRPQEPAYLLFALTTLSWLLRSLHYHLDLPYTRAGLAWFWWATYASMAWVMLMTFLFALRFARQAPGRFELGLTGLVVLGSLATMPGALASPGSILLQHGINVIVGSFGTVYVGVIALRERGRELRLIALSLFLALLMGAHDLALMAGWAWSEQIYLMPYATLIIVVTFMDAVQRRYVNALQQVEHTNVDLGLQLHAQNAELVAQHDRLREAERQQALLMERQRLMQDMHDGLGSSLLSAMVAVEQGSMDQDRVVEVLRECVDDLRLVIDSLEPVGHDLITLLATMRYRLGKRLQAGGLVLDWDVQDLPPLEWLEPPDALHVLRLLQEALSNVLKHARASRVRIVTRPLGPLVEIRVEDDGDGFDLETAHHGRGLKSQQRRAQRLGGRVDFESMPGHGSRVTLRLPVKRVAEGPAYGPREPA